MIGTWQVQIALLAALQNAGVVSGRIYDAVPADAQFPYVHLGETQVLSNDISGKDGADEYRTMHIWSRYDGQKELFEIAASIETAIHAKPLTVSGRESAFAWVSDLRTMEDQDGRTQHGILTVRIQHFE